MSCTLVGAVAGRQNVTYTYGGQWSVVLMSRTLVGGTGRRRRRLVRDDDDQHGGADSEGL